MKTVHLDEIEATPADGITWKPIRAELGIESFGASAYVADAGEIVVPAHSETPGGGSGAHEELYVVVRGRATFTVDGETVDAPAGTLVLLQPGEHREARAEDAGTLVLTIGGKRGEAFTVSAWEYPALVRHARELGRFDEARALAGEGTERFGEHPFLLYELACAEEQDGRRDEALRLLARAIELGPFVCEWLAAEPVFDSLRGDPRFGEALGS